jgi:Rap1a immunity proteins
VKDSHSDFCSGFIVGARDGAVLATKLRDARAILDVPVEVKQEQTLAVVVKYLNDHPEERHKQAALLVIFALSKAFPPQG